MSAERDGAAARPPAIPADLFADCVSYLRARAEVERFVFVPPGARRERRGGGAGAKSAPDPAAIAGAAPRGGVATAAPAFVSALPTAAPLFDGLVPAAAAARVAPPARAPGAAERLAAFEAEIKDCISCPLGHTRTRFVFGSGSATADLMLVGEAPGREEDLQGVPFVGAAGELLTKILAAISLRRDEVYIANVLKCRPPGNRDPEPHEVESCKPYLAEQIRTISPRLLVALGRFAAQLLTGRAASLSQLRGGTYFWEGIPVIPTYHPSALLRYPTYKRPTWEDMKRVRAELDRLAAPADSAGGLT